MNSQEKTVWVGHPSQWINLGWFIFGAVFFFLGIPMLIALWKWLVVRSTRYELTTERLLMTEGVLNKRVDELELYRVKDYSQFNPLLLRIVGLGNVTINTSDRSHPFVSIEAIADAAELQRLLRTHSEICRSKKGVRELDTI